MYGSKEMGVQTRGSSRLTDQHRKELVLDLCESISSLNTPEEVGEVLTDLLTPKEIETIAKRLQIAVLLSKGEEYESIRRRLKVGFATIARVNTWLNLSGEGYRLIVSRKKKRKVVKEESKGQDLGELYNPYSWHNIKRRNTLYFLPQLLLEELMKSSSKKEKKKIFSIFDKLDLKSLEFKRENNKQFYEMFSKEDPKK